MERFSISQADFDSSKYMMGSFVSLAIPLFVVYCVLFACMCTMSHLAYIGTCVDQPPRI